LTNAVGALPEFRNASLGQRGYVSRVIIALIGISGGVMGNTNGQLKAIIADDEDAIIGLVKRLGNWEEYGIRLVAQANDGLTAYEQIVEYQTDIAILDIRMPEMSGLELIRRCVEEQRPVRFLLISGYQEFDYVKQAISYNVCEYLVKPINAKALNRALRKVSESISRERQAARLVDELNSRINQKDAKLWDLFFSQVAENALPERSVVNKDYAFDLQDGLFGILAMKVDHPLAVQERYAPLLMENLRWAVNEQLEPLCTSLGCHMQGQRLYCVMNYAPLAAEELEDAMEWALELCVREAKNYEQCYVTFGRNAADTEYAELPAMYAQAEAALEYRWIAAPGKLLRYNEAISAHCAQDAQIQLSPQQRDKLYGILEGQNANALKRYLQEVREGQLAAGLPPYKYRLILCDMARHIFETIENRCPQECNTGRREQTTLALDNWQEDFGRLQAQVEEMLLTAVKAQMDSKFFWNDRHIRAAKQYIGRNYQNSIQLEDVASAISLTPAYFSSLFKEKTGQSFSEYLQMARIDKAKELLASTNHNIKEVCWMVGYHDVKYFTRLFKQHINLTPSMYQKMYSSF
jgi:two-component system response regulator YesN